MTEERPEVPDVPTRTRGFITEDWAATVLGLLLVVLVLAGVITKAIVP